MKRENMPEFDIMRAVAILIILFHHLPDHSINFYNLNSFGINYDLSNLNILNRYFGLGTFVFISAFVLTKTNSGLETGKEIKKFFLKRYIRVIPLYVIALLIFLKIFANYIAPMNSFSFLAHIFGLQILFASKYCEPVFTLWFVGLIIPYYFVFVVLERYGKQIRSLLSWSVIITLICIMSIYFFGVIDKNFVLYFGIFIAAVICARYNILNKIRNYHMGIVLLTFLLTIYTYIFIIYPKISVQGAKPGLFSSIGLAAFFLTNILMLSTAIILYKFSRCIVGTICHPLLKLISFSSYSIFLFHRPLWWLMGHIYTPKENISKFSYVTLLGIPLIITCSYYIQKGYNKYSEKYLSKLLMK